MINPLNLTWQKDVISTRLRKGHTYTWHTHKHLYEKVEFDTYIVCEKLKSQWIKTYYQNAINLMEKVNFSNTLAEFLNNKTLIIHLAFKYQNHQPVQYHPEKKPKLISACRSSAVLVLFLILFCMIINKNIFFTVIDFV